MRYANRGVVNYFSAGVVAHDRRIGSWVYVGWWQCEQIGQIFAILAIFFGVGHNLI
jgi:hypothetical protein